MNNRIDKIIVHWSASGKKTSVEDIRSWHKAKGWRDIGYHRIILHDDAIPVTQKPIQHWSTLVKQGRYLDDDWVLSASETGAHTMGFNGSSIGICVIGNINYQMTEWQKTALHGTLDVLVRRFGLDKKQVFGHREFNSTQCPGKEVFEQVKLYRGF